jgi:hypothetical protein
MNLATSSGEVGSAIANIADVTASHAIAAPSRQASSRPGTVVVLDVGGSLPATVVMGNVLAGGSALAVAGT